VKSLYVRIWLTVLTALALFALASGWLMQRHMAAERERLESQTQSRAEAWADLLQRSLPPADAPASEQAQALQEWSMRLRLPLALDDAAGQRIAASESFQRREDDAGPGPPLRRLAVSVPLADGRSLWIARPNLRRRPSPGEGAGMSMRPMPPPGTYSPWPTLPGLPDGAGLLVLVGLLFLAVGAGAYPVVRRLTRRLELLKQGVETFGAGALDHRVAVEGRDEVAAVARSFNEAAGRVEALLRSNQSLLANASHELRSPLARLKMAVSLLDDAPPAQTQQLRQEIHTNIAELDALVEEVLLSSRLDAVAGLHQPERVELLVLGAEEAARVQGSAGGEPLAVVGEERLLRRALRNLLENARRYGRAGAASEVAEGDDITLDIRADGAWAELRVCDRGPGVPEAYRERIFEAFFRLPGHAERAGGVGLGLALVRQIAQRHGGSVRCEPRPGGGSCFVLRLPQAA
jgi:signal transduction histidine kinase